MYVNQGSVYLPKRWTMEVHRYVMEVQPWTMKVQRCGQQWMFSDFSSSCLCDMGYYMYICNKSTRYGDERIAANLLQEQWENH